MREVNSKRLFVANPTFISMSFLGEGCKGTAGYDWAAVADQVCPSAGWSHILLTSEAEHVSSNQPDSRWTRAGSSCLNHCNSHLMVPPQLWWTWALSHWLTRIIWILLVSKMTHWGQWRWYAPAHQAQHFLHSINIYILSGKDGESTGYLANEVLIKSPQTNQYKFDT